jgi:hypothetical protein
MHGQHSVGWLLCLIRQSAYRAYRRDYTLAGQSPVSFTTEAPCH